MAAPGYSDTTQSYISSATDMAYRMRGIGDEQLQSLRDRATKNYAVADEVAANAKGQGAMWGGQANKALDFYNTGYTPAMQQQLDFAKGYDTPQRRAQNRGMAISGVTQAGNTALDNAKQTLASYGVRDPSAGRSAGMDRSAKVNIGGQAAAAGTMSDLNTEALGQQYLSGAINTGLQLPGQAAQAGGLNIAAGNQQLQAPLAATQSAASTIGTPVQWYGLAGQELSEWNKAATSLANNQAFYDSMDAQGGNAALTGVMGGLGALNGMFGSSGMFGGGGALGGLFAGAHRGGTIPSYANGGMSDWGSGARYPGDPLYGLWEGVSPDAAPVYDQGEELGSGIGGTVGGIAGSIYGPIGRIAGREIGGRLGAGVGAAVQGDWKGALSNVTAGTPLSLMFAGGGQAPPGAINTGMAPPGSAMVPSSASPSGGATQDDVNAALEPGEFVMPRRAAMWYGEKFLQKLVAKADEERGEQTVAQPEMKRLPPAQRGLPPSFVSQGAAT